VTAETMEPDEHLAIVADAAHVRNTTTTDGMDVVGNAENYRRLSE
jgi:hypothetical protein